MGCHEAPAGREARLLGRRVSQNGAVEIANGDPVKRRASERLLVVHCCCALGDRGKCDKIVSRNQKREDTASRVLGHDKTAVVQIHVGWVDAVRQ